MKYINDHTLNIDANRLALMFDDAVGIAAGWYAGSDNGFIDAIAAHETSRGAVYALLQKEADDPYRSDRAPAGQCRSPFADFTEIRTAEAPCGGGSEAAYFAELSDGITVGYADGGTYYHLTEQQIRDLPVPSRGGNR